MQRYKKFPNHPFKKENNKYNKYYAIQPAAFLEDKKDKKYNHDIRRDNF